MKFLIVVFASLCFFIAFPSHVLAARSMTITSDKTSLFGDEEMTITASVSGFTPGETIYIKGAFYQEGSTNYFGYTKNGDAWIKNGDTSTNQRSIVVDSWDGNLSVKSDFADSGYKGEGEYKAKVGFYYTTSGGNPSSVNWTGNNVTVTLNEPDPTPTSTPTPTPTPQATATPTPTPVPTKTPTPTPSLTQVVNFTNTPKNSPTPTKTSTTAQFMNSTTPTITQSMSLGNSDESFTFRSDIGDVLSSSTVSGNIASEIEKSKRSLKPYIYSFLFIGIGCALLVFVYYFKKGFLFKKDHDQV